MSLGYILDAMVKLLRPLSPSQRKALLDALDNLYGLAEMDKDNK